MNPRQLRHVLSVFLTLPGLALAQVAGPFGGTAQLPAAFLAIGAPIATVALMASFIAACMSRLPWGWFAGIAIGIIGFFGAPQLVAWVRTLFGV